MLNVLLKVGALLKPSPWECDLVPGSSLISLLSCCHTISNFCPPHFCNDVICLGIKAWTTLSETLTKIKLSQFKFQVSNILPVTNIVGRRQKNNSWRWLGKYKVMRNHNTCWQERIGFMDTNKERSAPTLQEECCYSTVSTGRIQQGYTLNHCSPSSVHEECILNNTSSVKVQCWQAG